MLFLIICHLNLCSGSDQFRSVLSSRLVGRVLLLKDFLPIMPTTICASRRTISAGRALNGRQDGGAEGRVEDDHPRYPSNALVAQLRERVDQS